MCSPIAAAFASFMTFVGISLNSLFKNCMNSGNLKFVRLGETTSFFFLFKSPAMEIPMPKMLFPVSNLILDWLTNFVSFFSNSGSLVLKIFLLTISPDSLKIADFKFVPPISIPINIGSHLFF